MVVVLRMLLSLSLSHTHTSINRRPFSHVYTMYRHLSMSHSCMIICTFTPLYVSITRTPSPHCPSATTHIWTHTRVLSQSHTQNQYKKMSRAHLKRPNPNKHELKLNSNIWKYCSVKNFSRKKNQSNIRGLFSHTQKGSV